MSIEEYGLGLNLMLTCRRYPWGWAASFDNCEIKHESFLIGAYGQGDSPEEAIRDYVTKIKGQLLVHSAYRDSRREFNVPESLGATVGQLVP